MVARPLPCRHTWRGALPVTVLFRTLMAMNKLSGFRVKFAHGEEADVGVTAGLMTGGVKTLCKDACWELRRRAG